MSIILVGSTLTASNTGVSNGTIVGTQVSGGAVGNLLIAFYVSGDGLNPSTLTHPTGWNHVKTNMDSRDGIYSNGNFTNHWFIAWKLRTATDNLTWTVGAATGDDQLAIMEFSGAFDTVNPLSVISAYTEVNAADVTVPSVTPTVISSALLSLAVSRGYTSSAVDTGQPSGMSVIFNRQSRSNSSAVRSAAAFLQLGSVSATGPVTWTAFRGDTSNQLGGINLIIKSGALPQTVSDINNNSAVTVGQVAVPSTIAGFSALPSISCTYTGGSVPVTNITGTATSPLFKLGDRVHGSPYPAADTLLTFTYVNGIENAVGTQKLANRPGEVDVVFANANTTSADFITKKLAADGHVVNGGTLTYDATPDFSVGTDGGLSYKNNCNVGAWFRPSVNGTNGSTAGCTYFYLIQANGALAKGTSLNLTMKKSPLGDYISGMPTINPSKTYLMDTGFGTNNVPFPMQAITPNAKAGPDAYFKWATTNMLYMVRLGWIGGRGPFRVTLVSGPASAYIGTGGKEQTLVRTADASSAGIYAHTLPTNFNVVCWQPTAGDIGTTVTFVVLVEDQDKKVLTMRWKATVDDTKFVWADMVNGNDSNPGTFASKKKTQAAVHVLSGKICVYMDGTYPVTSSSLNNSSNTAKTHIGYGNGCIFDMTQQQFGCSTPSTDYSFINVTFNGCIATNADVRMFNMNGKLDRPLWWRCKWRNVTIGTGGTDNPSCVFICNLNTGPTTAVALADADTHTDIAFLDCDTDSSVIIQMFGLFSSNRVLAEGNRGLYPLDTPSSNGTHFMHFKDQCSYVTCRYNFASGNIKNAYGLVSFSNQSPFHCKFQEFCWNTLVSTNGQALAWNIQNTTAGNTAIGQTVGATNQYCYRNTFVMLTNDQPLSIPNYGIGGVVEPVNISDNLFITTASSVAFTNYSNNGGFTLTGDNTIRPQSTVDGSYKLTGSARTTLLGKVGAETASTTPV